jgi:hypothetical protein
MCNNQECQAVLRELTEQKHFLARWFNILSGRFDGEDNKLCNLDKKLSILIESVNVAKTPSATPHILADEQCRPSRIVVPGLTGDITTRCENEVCTQQQPIGRKSLSLLISHLYPKISSVQYFIECYEKSTIPSGEYVVEADFADVKPVVQNDDSRNNGKLQPPYSLKNLLEIMAADEVAPNSTPINQNKSSTLNFVSSSLDYMYPAVKCEPEAKRVKLSTGNLKSILKKNTSTSRNSLSDVSKVVFDLPLLSFTDMT